MLGYQLYTYTATYLKTMLSNGDIKLNLVHKTWDTWCNTLIIHRKKNMWELQTVDIPRTSQLTTINPNGRNLHLANLILNNV